MEQQDNFHEVEPETIKEIISTLAEKIKEGKIYKGKAGENFRIYTSRLLECFAICKVPLSEDEIACFKVGLLLLRTLSSKTSRTHSNRSCNLQ